MTETICAGCHERVDSHWRIRLEHDSTEGHREAPYHLCRGCWGAFQERLSGAES